MRAFFAGAAEHLRETDYADACPIATVALEVSSSSEMMREACAEVFESWIAAGHRRVHDRGTEESIARELAIGMFAALEGAFVLARAVRGTEALDTAGELMARAVQRALHAAGLTQPPARRQRGTRPPAAPGSLAGPCGAAIPAPASP